MRLERGAVSRSSSAVLAAAGVVLVLGVVAVQGEEKPATTTPANPAAGVFQPSKITMVATHSMNPLSRKWNAEQRVRILSADPEQTAALASNLETRLSGGDDDQLTATVTTAEVRGSYVEATIKVDSVPADGAYAGTLSLDPLTEKSAALELLVNARHPFLFPLVVLLGGMAIGWLGTALYERYRRRTALQIVLADAGAWLQSVPNLSGHYDLAAELIGNGSASDLTPSDKRCSTRPPLPALYCELGGAVLPDKIDGLSKRVQTMIARMDMWFQQREALCELRASYARVPKDASERIQTDYEALMIQFATDPDDGGLELVTKARGQAKVEELFADAWEAWEDAGKQPIDLNPDAALRGHKPAQQRTAEETDVLLGNLRTILAQLRNGRHQIVTLDLHTNRSIPGWALSTDLTTPTDVMAEAQPPPWADEGESNAISRKMRDSIVAADASVFAVQAVVAGVAFLLPVYTATNFGSLSQYLSVFTAGFLGKVALDEALSPFRSLQVGPKGETMGTKADTESPEEDTEDEAKA